MARKLTFILGESKFECTVDKVDRTKLYGRKEIVVESAKGEPLHKGYLDEWGSVLIQSSGMGYMDDERLWRSRNELVAVNGLGVPLETFPSTFDEPIELSEKASLDELLISEVSAVYVLRAHNQERLADAVLESADFFVFPFNYRAGHSPKRAFLNPTGANLFLMVTEVTKLSYLQKPQRFEIEDFDDEDDIDFSMM